MTTLELIWELHKQKIVNALEIQKGQENFRRNVDQGTDEYLVSLIKWTLDNQFYWLSEMFKLERESNENSVRYQKAYVAYMLTGENAQYAIDEQNRRKAN